MKLHIARTPEDDAAGKPLDLGAAIAEFYAEFPQHRKDVFILNHQAFATGKEAVESIAADIDALQKEFPQAKTKFAKSLALGTFEGKLPCSVNISESSFNGKKDTKIFGRIVIPAGEQFTARVMKSIFAANDPFPNSEFPVMAPQHNNTEMWQRYVLDHELGHALTMVSIDKQSQKETSFGNKAECEADAYAMIRHFQRYGADSDFPAYVRDLRNMNAVHKGDITHWTSRAIERVIVLNQQGALAHLTPEQSRDLAVEIAGQTALSADAAHNMQEAFAATRKIMAQGLRAGKKMGDNVMSYMKAVCEIGAETQSPAVHDACLRYMDRLRDFLPPDMPQNATPDDLRQMRQWHEQMRKRQPLQEPPMTGLKRVFRDASLDAQSGLKSAERKPGSKPSKGMDKPGL